MEIDAIDATGSWRKALVMWGSLEETSLLVAVSDDTERGGEGASRRTASRRITGVSKVPAAALLSSDSSRRRVGFGHRQQKPVLHGFEP